VVDVELCGGTILCLYDLVLLPSLKNETRLSKILSSCNSCHAEDTDYTGYGLCAIEKLLIWLMRHEGVVWQERRFGILTQRVAFV